MNCKLQLVVVSTLHKLFSLVVFQTLYIVHPILFSNSHVLAHVVGFEITYARPSRYGLVSTICNFKNQLLSFWGTTAHMIDDLVITYPLGTGLVLCFLQTAAGLVPRRVSCVSAPWSRIA